jgi:hypothetical protein
MANTHEIGSIVTVEAKFDEQIAACKLFYRRPDSTAVVEYVLSAGEKLADGTVRAEIEVDAPGEWYYRFEAQDPQVGTADGAFFVDGDQVRDGVTDLRDLRTLIPRVRRALEGPTTNALSTTLNDDAAEAVIADAVADVILYSHGSIFGYTLEVTARDSRYSAPVAWRTDKEMDVAAQSVVVAQAAINHLFHELKGAKIQETIRDEGGEWSYSLSAGVLTKQLDLLVRLRDEALAAVQGPIFDSYVSFLAVRDATTARLIEACDVGLGGQQGDSRFGTVA